MDPRESVVAAGRALVARGLAHGTAGNVSLRSEDDRAAYVKPSAVPYATMRAIDVPLVEIATGRVLAGERAPSSEVQMHLAIYAARGDVRAVAHGHPPHATALAGARRAIPPFLDEVAAFLGGGVEVSEYAPSGTRELAENVALALGHRAGVLIANHGAVGVGRTMEEAVEALALVEYAAQVSLLSLQAGGPVTLPEAALARWREFYASGTRRY